MKISKKTFVIFFSTIVSLSIFQLGCVRSPESRKANSQVQSQNAEAYNASMQASKTSQLLTQTKDTPQSSDDKYSPSTISGETTKDKIILNWTKINHPAFSGYKVVISKNNSAPKYPEDGYLYYITDNNVTSAEVDSSISYNGGDFGGKLLPGENYFFSITVLYGDKAVSGNVVSLKCPLKETQPAPQQQSDPQPSPKPAPAPKPAPTPAPAPAPVPQTTNKAVVSGVISNNKILLNWNKVSGEDFVYYKVVISKNNSSPVYPDDGYLIYITDVNTTSAVVDNKCKYNGGDFGGYLKPGEKYWFSITSVYSNERVAGNAVSMTYPASGYYPVSSYKASTLQASVENGKVNLNWTKIDSSNFSGYKVVISKDNPKPSYPNDGYLFWITDKDENHAVFDNECAYNGGDFGGKLISGEKYYVTITVVYSDKKVTGNVLEIVMP